MNVLIVEDEIELSKSICEYLSNEQFICEQVNNYHDAHDKISLFDYACIVLDIGLPDGSGLDLLKELKIENKVDGVLIVSAKNSIDDKVEGLNAGADDYLTKPFHLSELAARVASIIRRKAFSGNNYLTFGDLEIDILQKTVKAHGKDLELTKKEYQLLLYFLGNKNKVISKSAIAIHLWGDEMDMASNYDFIYTHIKNLRKKLALADAGDYLQSVYGMGYRMTSPS